MIGAWIPLPGARKGDCGVIRIRILVLLLAAGALPAGALGGCAATPEAAGEPEIHRAHCDELALEATRTESFDEARQFATRAAECYEELQAQRR